MKKEKKQKIILGVLGVVLLFSVYNVFFKKAEFESELTFNSSSEIESTVGREIITTLNKLQTIQIDPAFFESELFNSLINFHVELSPEPISKPDPFAITQEGNVVTESDDQQEDDSESTTPDDDIQ